MLGLMEKQLELKNIPWEYELCFNENCPLRKKCLHYQAYLLQPARRLGGPAIYPSAWKSGECSRFTEARVPTIVSITVSACSRPASSATSCTYCPNTAAPKASPSTITSLTSTLVNCMKKPPRRKGGFFVVHCSGGLNPPASGLRDTQGEP